MAYCTNCGTASSGAFCPQCGTTMAATQPQTQAATQQASPPHLPLHQTWQQPVYSPPPPRKSSGMLIGLAVGGGVVALGIVGVVLFASLGDSAPPTAPASNRSGGSSPSSSKPSNPPSSSSSAKVTRKPGYITGIVLDERGAPLKVSPDQITIRIFGTRTEDGQQMSGIAPVQADGRFEMKVPEGNFGATGFVKVDFEGTEYWLSLEPVGGKNPEDSKQGIVKEMRLKLSGQIPGLDAKNPYSYYGGHIRMQYQGTTLPESAQVKFTLTPLTPLADGSQGKALTYTVTGKQLRSNAPMADIPLARYRITGEVTMPDGGKKVALIQTAGGEPGPAQEFTFRPNSTGEGIEGVFLWMRGEQ